MIHPCMTQLPYLRPPLGLLVGSEPPKLAGAVERPVALVVGDERAVERDLKPQFFFSFFWMRLYRVRTQSAEGAPISTNYRSEGCSIRHLLRHCGPRSRALYLGSDGVSGSERRTRRTGGGLMSKSLYKAWQLEDHPVSVSNVVQDRAPVHVVWRQRVA